MTKPGRINFLSSQIFPVAAVCRVSTQLDFGDESFIAFVASKRPFASMSHDVIAQLSFGMGESFLAVRAKVRSLFLVSSLMSLEMRRIREGFTAGDNQRAGDMIHFLQCVENWD